MTVEDDDLRDEPAITVTTLSITANPATVTEGADANLSFTVRSSLPAPFGGIEVTVVLAGADAFVDDDDDDTPGITDETVTIADGQTSVAVQFPITDDDVAEVDAMVLALLDTVDFAVVSSSAKATIYDDEARDATLAMLSVQRCRRRHRLARAKL